MTQVIRDTPRSFGPTPCSKEGSLWSQIQVILPWVICCRKYQGTQYQSMLHCDTEQNTLCSSKPNKMWKAQDRFTQRGYGDYGSYKILGSTAERGHALHLMRAETLQGCREPLLLPIGVTDASIYFSRYKIHLESTYTEGILKITFSVVLLEGKKYFMFPLPFWTHSGASYKGKATSC